MRFGIITSLACVSGLASVSAFAAKASSGAAELRQAIGKAKADCAQDIDKLCSDVTPGGGRVLDCLSSKADKLSTSCANSQTDLKAAASKAMDRATVAFRKDCGGDVQKFCKDVPSGQGRLLDCLSKHEDGLSGSCKNFEAKLSEKVQEFWSS